MKPRPDPGELDGASDPQMPGLSIADPTTRSGDATQDSARLGRPDGSGWSGRIVHRVERSGAADFASPATTRIFLLLFIAAMLCGPTALLLSTTRRQAQSPPPAASAAVSDDRDRLRAAAAAVELVRVWSSAGGKDLPAVRSAMGRDPGPVTLPVQRPATPTWVQAVDAQQTEPGEWTVTVTADADPAGRGAAYAVLVTVTADQARVMTLPARVANPVVDQIDTDLDVLSGGDLRAVTAAGFLRSFLTGADDLTRWLAPETSVQPVGKACRNVSITRIETGSNDNAPSTAAAVLATAICQTGTDRTQVQTLQYPLTLQLRDGRWEVVRYSNTLPTIDTPLPAHPTPAATSGPPTTGTR